jgi:phage terminase large subunit-like protein
MTSLLSPELSQQILIDQRLRRALTRESHFWFFHVYFSHYVTSPTAQFQKEIFDLTDDASQKLVAITAFRGSGKSTIVNLSFPLWAILGKLQVKFVLILGQTQSQARQHLKNLKDEIERNPLLRKDLGPFDEKEDEWNSSSIVLPLLGARITAASTETSVRGIRHGQHRPQLIICDDIEDLQSAKTKEGRDKTYQWLSGEVIPAGSPQTRTFLIGNLLHEDCLLKRFERSIKEGTVGGTYKEFPLINAEGKCLWPGKYPTPESITEEKLRIGSESAWHREFLLHILSDTERVVHPEWVKFYDEVPADTSPNFQYFATGIDLAISKNDTADYTAMVSAKVFREKGKQKVYILPPPINERMTALETVERAKILSASIRNGRTHNFYVEDVGYQAAMVELLEDARLTAEGVGTKGQDKRGRLMLAATMIQSGKVLFPKQGAEDLLTQLLGFGTERHDDLADAFAILVLKLMEDRHTGFGAMLIGYDGSVQMFGSFADEE